MRAVLLERIMNGKLSEYSLEHDDNYIRSFESGMPEELPERLEWGTPALPAIASLGAGVEYLEKTGYEEISSRISALNARCREGIGNIKGLQLRGMEYNPPKGQESGCLLFT